MGYLQQQLLELFLAPQTLFQCWLCAQYDIQDSLHVDLNFGQTINFLQGTIIEAMGIIEYQDDGFSTPCLLSRDLVFEQPEKIVSVG